MFSEILNTFSNKFTPSETFSSPTKKTTKNPQQSALNFAQCNICAVDVIVGSDESQFSSAHIFFFITLSVSSPPNLTPAGPIRNRMIRAVVMIILLILIIIDEPQTLTNTDAPPSPAVFCGSCARRRRFLFACAFDLRATYLCRRRDASETRERWRDF